MGVSSKSRVFIFGGVILLAILWRMSFVIWNVLPFDADEAIVGLMAKHILVGERPIFFYGQYYMGSLDAYWVSLGFLLFGQKVWVIRLMQALLFSATVFIVMKIGEEAFGNLKAGLFAGLLLVIPNVNLLLYSTASLGGYGEALFFSALILLITLYLKRNLTAATVDQRKTIMLSIFLGIISGLAFWVNNLTVVVSFPCIVFVLVYLLKASMQSRKKWRVFLILVLGFSLGLTPIWISMIQNGFGSVFRDLTGNAYTGESGSVLQKIGNHIFSFFFLGLPALIGIRAPWDVRWLAVPVIPLLVATYLAVLLWSGINATRKSSTRGLYFLFAGIGTFFFILFIFTPFGIDPTGRYFLPLNIVLSLMVANFVFSVRFQKWVAIGVASIILVFNIWSTLQCALQNPPGITTYLDSTNRIDHSADPNLIAFLEENKIDEGYSSYWVSYPLAFLSNEELIFLPQLPYHTSMQVSTRDDRYKPYDAIVEQAPQVAYITVRFPTLDDRLRSAFESLHITWQETVIGNYHVFYHLSQKVTPQELGLAFK